MYEGQDWIDERSGFHCLIRNGPLLALCGYVGIPQEHPLYGVPFMGCAEGHAPSTTYGGKYPGDQFLASKRMADKPIWECTDSGLPDGQRHERLDAMFTVHGGLTYGGQGVVGMRKDHWYLGFDCTHAGDYVPGLHTPEIIAKLGHDIFTDPSDILREEPYVRENILGLVMQLFEFANERAAVSPTTRVQEGHDG